MAPGEAIMSLPRLPKLADLPARPRRQIVHWTAGRHTFSASERKRYHGAVESRIVDGVEAVRWVPGVPLERNMGMAPGTPTAHSAHPDASTRGYAAHTGSRNSYSIGWALCGMWQATDYRPTRPVNPGPEPITQLQIEYFVRGLAATCRAYELEPIPEQLHDHWETHHVHGIQQRGGVWDLQWIPGENLTRGECGDWLRDRVRFELEGRKVRVFPVIELEPPRWPVKPIRSRVPPRVFPLPR